MKKKYSFFKPFLLGVAVNGAKALLIAFALSLTGKILYRILHEDFSPLVKDILFSSELYEDTLLLAVVMVIFSLADVYDFSRKYYDNKKKNGE